MSAIARRRPVAAIVLAGLVVGCGTPTTSPSPAPAGLPSGLADDHTLLLVEEYGGLMGWQDASTQRRFALTADGVLLSVDPPGGSKLQAIRATRLEPDALAQAWATVQASGVARDGKLDIPDLFDAGSTFFTVDDGLHATTLQVYGLATGADFIGGDIPVPSGDVPARIAARDLLAELALRGIRGEPVDAHRLAVYIASAGDGLLPTVPWTGALDLATAGTPVTAPGFERCAVLAGADAVATAAIGHALAADSVVKQDGVQWIVGFRPLFADEPDPPGCSPA